MCFSHPTLHGLAADIPQDRLLVNLSPLYVHSHMVLGLKYQTRLSGMVPCPTTISSISLPARLCSTLAICVRLQVLQGTAGQPARHACPLALTAAELQER